MNTACAQYRTAIAADPAITKRARPRRSVSNAGVGSSSGRGGRGAMCLSGVVMGVLLRNAQFPTPNSQMGILGVGDWELGVDHVTARPARSWSALLMATAALAPSA